MLCVKHVLGFYVSFSLGKKRPYLFPDVGVLISSSCSFYLEIIFLLPIALILFRRWWLTVLFNENWNKFKSSQQVHEKQEQRQNEMVPLFSELCHGVGNLGCFISFETSIWNKNYTMLRLAQTCGFFPATWNFREISIKQFWILAQVNYTKIIWCNMLEYQLFCLLLTFFLQYLPVILINANLCYNTIF